jgi:MSHA biogenesis protein MshM
MYLEHFGLHDFPFGLTPNTELILDQGGHREALNVLLVALGGGEGFIKVTGEVGTGKTLLCRQLMRVLGDRVVTAYLPNPDCTPTGLRLALAEELELPIPTSGARHRVPHQLTDHLLALAQQGRRVVVLIDEAQAMPEWTLEAVRLLTNLETERRKLLQVVLFGQPELDERLASPRLRQLRQRISFSYRLPPLPAALLAPYLEHRLHACGYRGELPFVRRALVLLHAGSRGIPRLVNILAHKSMLAVYGEGGRRVGARHVQRAIRDTDDARIVRLWWLPRPSFGPRGMSA